MLDVVVVLLTDYFMSCRLTELYSYSLTEDFIVQSRPASGMWAHDRHQQHASRGKKLCAHYDWSNAECQTRSPKRHAAPENPLHPAYSGMKSTDWAMSQRGHAVGQPDAPRFEGTDSHSYKNKLIQMESDFQRGYNDDVRAPMQTNTQT